MATLSTNVLLFSDEAALLQCSAKFKTAGKWEFQNEATCVERWRLHWKPPVKKVAQGR